ncbi:hypothetical protein CEUSTIGMA_g10744.t1 [Chlamydomonas eustigma]|uniref:Uncharacterized protein n=1 Tax=Chlamydomonas eustigma TaxID=1157962 RepID=A0A250XJS7_9CHLO|nr:hypothetical protein CEUSTIGMA_g10744.t1 [Chlamydomonas eustigma]|eukprot:GAX83318.1 hypothetical protein CEUSTIGMA_g10744.t1 [Chlamydomonas eustigma]
MEIQRKKYKQPRLQKNPAPVFVLQAGFALKYVAKFEKNSDRLCVLAIPDDVKVEKVVFDPKSPPMIDDFSIEALSVRWRARWIAKIENEEWYPSGAAVLVQLSPLKYLFVGDCIYEFEAQPKEEITEFRAILEGDKPLSTIAQVSFSKVPRRYRLHDTVWRATKRPSGDPVTVFLGPCEVTRIREVAKYCTLTVRPVKPSCGPMEAILDLERIGLTKLRNIEDTCPEVKKILGGELGMDVFDVFRSCIVEDGSILLDRVSLKVLPRVGQVLVIGIELVGIVARNNTLLGLAWEVPSILPLLEEYDEEPEVDFEEVRNGLKERLKKKSSHLYELSQRVVDAATIAELEELDGEIE